SARSSPRQRTPSRRAGIAGPSSCANPARTRYNDARGRHMTGSYERHFDFEQVFNFRDLGGYASGDGRTLRWRRLFRTVEHQRMRPEEVERLFSEIPLRTVIDFRSDGESGDPRGVGALCRDGVRRLHFPMGNANSKHEALAAGTWVPNYVASLEGYPEHWAEAYRVLADEESYPTVFHC